MLYVCGRIVLVLSIAMSFQACSVRIEALNNPNGTSSLVAVDTTPPTAASAPAWVEVSPRASTNVTASWTMSTSLDLSNQKIQFYSDSSCTTASGSLINLSSSTAQTYAWTAPGSGTFAYKLSSWDAAGNSTDSVCSSSMVIDVTAPDAATGLAWVEASPSLSLSVTASWTKSISTDFSNQKIQFYSDSSCTTASGSLIDLASASTQSYAWTSPGDGTYAFKISSFDALGNTSVSACSSSMVVNQCLGLDALVPFARGDGSAGDPYGICSKEQMNRVGSNAAYLDKHFILLKNLDLASYTANSFTLIGSLATPYVGTFNGNGKVLSNLTYSLAADYVGLFRKIGTNGVVKNLGVEAATITGNNYTGIIAGETVGSIENCHSQGTVVGSTRVGALSGRFWESNASSIIKDSYSSGSVSGTEFIGGLIGWVRGTVKTSHYTGTVNSSTNRTGGLIGIVDQGSVQTCYADATVVALGYGVGGLVGAIGGNISNSYAKGSVSGTDWVGGIVGWNGSGGAFNGTITKTYSENTITARDSVGGITGYAYATGPLSDCYSRSSITARDYVGGLVGSNAGTLTNSYAANPTLTASIGHIGGLQGNGTGAVTNSFWDVSINGVTVSGHDAISNGVGGETTTTMKTATTYTTPGWSAATWDIVDGSYPTLK